MFVIKDLTVAVQDRVLFRGFDLEMSAREIVALTGPSGSGKTSLLRTVSVLDGDREQCVALEGKTAGEIGYPVYRRQVAYFPQQAVLSAGTVREAIVRPFAYQSADFAFPSELCDSLLEQAALSTDLLDQEVRTLSVGERQRVALVRGLLTRPRVLLLDEPTSSLDESAVQMVEKLIEQHIRETKACALVVTHAPDQVARLCHRAVEIPALEKAADAT